MILFAIIAGDVVSELEVTQFAVVLVVVVVAVVLGFEFPGFVTTGARC